MLSKDTLRVAATVTVGFGIAFLIVGSSQTFQSCMSQHYHHESSETFQKGAAQFLVMLKSGSGCTGEFVHKNAESIIALFTVILGIATWLLWRSTQALVKGAEQTAQRQLRAYVMIDKAWVEKLGPNSQPEARLIIKNSGQTPAYEVTHWCASAVGPYPLPPGAIEQVKGQEVEMPSRPLAPGGETGVWSNDSGVVTDEQYKAIFEKTAAFFVVGEIRYIDSFGNRQETDFLLFSGGPIGLTGELAGYITGNRAT